MMKIEITIPDDCGDPSEYLKKSLSALGYAPARSWAVVDKDAAEMYKRTAAVLADRADEVAKEAREVGKVRELAMGYGADAGTETAAEALPSVMDEASVQQTVAKRERGQPSAGRKRRTKEELAEDAAADAADAAAGNISTNPEDRRDPEAEDEAIPTAVDSPEVDAQDEADEAAEEAARGGTDAVTLDTLRKLVAEISKKHGMPVAVKVPKYLGKPLAEIDEADYDSTCETLEAMLDMDTDDLKATLADVGTEAAKPVEKPVEKTPEKPKAPSATKDEVIQAMYRYADYADKTRDQNAMPHTQADLPLIFSEALGPNVKTLNQIAPDKYGEALAAIDEAIRTDRFKRK
ncbi:helicase [EBPR siphovirus 2]|nr:helicase [EBPR siphovirus 2]